MLDLTKPLNKETAIYTEGDYRDPPFECSTWATIKDRGYWVSKLSLGTQTGTHIDAPAHFYEDGASLGQLLLEKCIGSYCLIDLAEIAGKGEGPEFAESYQGEPILFIKALNVRAIDARAFDALLRLPADIWIVAGEIEVAGKPLFFSHQALARAGKFLVEDLDPEAAARVKAGGEVFVMPLKLCDVSGSPCRVVVREVKNA